MIDENTRQWLVWITKRASTALTDRNLIFNSMTYLKEISDAAANALGEVRYETTQAQRSKG